MIASEFIITCLILIIAYLTYLLRRQARYDRLRALLLREPKSFDLAWGDLKTGRVTSPSRFSLFRKWGLPLPDEESCDLGTLSRVLGRDLYRECTDGLTALKGTPEEALVSEESVYAPQEGRRRHYRRYLYRLDDRRFACRLEDVTFETDQSQALATASPEVLGAPLSELLSRRAMNARLLEKCAERRENGGRAFLIMLDIDNFRKINDGYGHDAGDAVLKAVSNIVRSLDDGRALTARWGGEEFLAAVDRDEAEEAREAAQSLLRLAAAAEVPLEGTDKVIKLTVSAGVAELDAENHIISIQRADKALYEAKYDGKNCVRLWRPDNGKALPELKLSQAS